MVIRALTRRCADVVAAEAATAAGIGPSYNVLDGFEGGLDAEGHRGAVGWRALGLPWRQW